LIGKNWISATVFGMNCLALAIPGSRCDDQIRPPAARLTLAALVV
jgi:hypothetical protein